MRKPSDLQTDLMQIDSTDLWDGLFRTLPNELIIYIFSFLSLNDYVSFAFTSEKHHQALIANAFINSYDPQLPIFLKVAVHFVKQTSGKTCEEGHTPLSIIKEIIPIYAKVKAQVLTTEIELKENVLIAILDCSLSGMNDASKKELKWDFLSQIFEKYFKIQTHFMFDVEKLPLVFTNSTKLDYLIACINQKEADSFHPIESDVDKVNESMVIYFYAQSILLSFPHLHKMYVAPRKVALTRAEGYCIAAYNRGAHNAIFLLRLIYQRLIKYKIASKLSPQQVSTPCEFEKSVAEFLGIEKFDKKSLYEILGEFFFTWLCVAPRKLLKVLKKLLASNTMDEIRAVEKSIKLWNCLIRGKYSLEFLNTFGSEISKLQDLNSTGFLAYICHSPAASMIGAMLKKKASTCELIYQKLGFEKLLQCSEIIVETRATNLLQALSDLEINQLTKILVAARGNIESLRQVIIKQSIINPSVLPSVSFFASSSNKRSHEQTQTTEPEVTDSNPKVPRLSNGKAEEE